MPGGMGDRAVHKQMPESDENDHGVIFHTVSERANDESRCNDL